MENFDLIFDDDDELLEVLALRHLGTAVRMPNKRGATKRRDPFGALARVNSYYFDENCLYGDDMFKRRFRMTRRMYMMLETKLLEYPFFQDFSIDIFMFL